MESIDWGDSSIEDGLEFGMGFTDSVVSNNMSVVTGKSFATGSLQAGSLTLSCAHKNSPDRQYLSGYTGKKFKSKEYTEMKDSIVPAIGFTGYYKGKIHGKLGRVELHNSSISVAEEEKEDISEARKKYKLNSVVREKQFNANPHLGLKYEISQKLSNNRGNPVRKVLADIAEKLELRCSGRMQRHLLVRNTFALYDIGGRELCSVDDFYASLLHMSIMLPNIEFESLCNHFDERRTGEISWAKFMNSIGAGLT